MFMYGVRIGSWVLRWSFIMCTVEGRGAARGKAPFVLKRKGAGTNLVEVAFTKWNSLNPSGSCIRQVELSIRWNSFFEFHFHSSGHDLSAKPTRWIDPAKFAWDGGSTGLFIQHVLWVSWWISPRNNYQLGQAPCAPRLKYDARYNVNWAGPDLGTLIFTNSPFLWHTLHLFPLCPFIISSPGKHMAWPSCHHSSSSLSFTNWLNSVVKAGRYMHALGSNSR